VTRRELAEIEGHLEVVSTTLVAGRPMVRICSDENPGNGFEPVPADIEDVYFLRVAA
jgi:hypothetical protein